VTSLVNGALTASGYLFVIQCQLKLGYTAAQAGAAFIRQRFSSLPARPLAVQRSLVSRIGPRWLMFAEIVLIAVAQLRLAQVQPGSGYSGTILPGAVVQGVGLGLMVTPLTAAVLAAVSDSDLGEASALNDAPAQVGAVVAIAVVPALIGVGAGSSLADPLTDGYRPAMSAIGAVCAAAAVLAAVFVSSERSACPHLAAPAPHHGCALPVMDSARMRRQPTNGGPMTIATARPDT
jgi:MFS family permease